MKVESKGVIKFRDEINNISAEITMDSVKKRPSDYLSGTIKVADKVVSKVYGTFMGFIEFDDQRYWDYRYVLPFQPIILDTNIGSDHSKREDKIALLKGDIINAQKHKEDMEELQRSDAILRKKFKEKEKEKKKK